MATEHHLKCWPNSFDAIEDGTKTFEVRRNDRGYQTGDVLVLKRYDPKGECFIARRDGSREPLRMRVTYVLSGRGIEHGSVVLAVAREDATP